jgi:hypothetical protein
MARLSPEEQRLIDEAIQAGRVTRVPVGVSALEPEYRWCDKVRGLVPVEKGGASRSFGWPSRHRPDAQAAYHRRGRVKALHAEGLRPAQVAERLGVKVQTVHNDAAILGIRFGRGG